MVSLFADPLIKKLGGTNRCIVLGALFHSIYTAAMILPALMGTEHWDQPWLHTFTYVFILLAAAMNGFSSGFLWVSQGTYINDCANNSNKGLYNAIFLSAVCGGAFIVGNLMSTYVVKYFSETILFISFGAMSFAITIYLMFLKVPRPYVVDVADTTAVASILAAPLDRDGSRALLNKSSLVRS